MAILTFHSAILHHTLLLARAFALATFTVFAFLGHRRVFAAFQFEAGITRKQLCTNMITGPQLFEPEGAGRLCVQ